MRKTHFYESGYVPDWEKVKTKISNGAEEVNKYFSNLLDALERFSKVNETKDAKQTPPSKSNLLHAIELLADAGYKRVLVCVPDMHDITGISIRESSNLINEILDSKENFQFVRTQSKLIYKGAEFYFFVHRDDKDIIRLRGPQFDSAIIKGKPSSDFSTMLTFTLRLGYNPIIVQVFGN